MCRLTENVSVIPVILLFRNFVLSIFARFVSRIPLLYYRVHFLASSSQKIQTEVKFSEPTEQQQFVRGPVVPAKGAFIIYERGGGWGENLKISIFFSGPPPQELNVYSNISMMISFGLVFQIYNFT